MDNELLKQLAHFKVLVKKTLAESVDISRLMNDKPYASELLKRTEDSDNEEIVFLSLTLRDRLGLLAAEPTPAAATTTDPAKEPPPAAKKYVLGTRG